MVHAISHTIIDFNQQSYQRLKSALALNLRRQIFIGICDDLQLRDRLVHSLEEDLSGSSTAVSRGRYQPYPYLVSLQLSLENPDPIAQISQWLGHNPPPEQQHRHAPMPAFQLVGVEQLSRHDASLQWLFLNHLRGIERSMPALESTLLLWVTRPWSRMIPQAAPNFWRCRTAIFDFIGEPTPFISQPETFPIAVERSPNTASRSESHDSTNSSDPQSPPELNTDSEATADQKPEHQTPATNSDSQHPPSDPQSDALDSKREALDSEGLDSASPHHSSYSDGEITGSQGSSSETVQQAFVQDAFVQDKFAPGESVSGESIPEEPVQEEADQTKSDQDEHPKDDLVQKNSVQDESVQDQTRPKELTLEHSVEEGIQEARIQEAAAQDSFTLESSVQDEPSQTEPSQTEPSQTEPSQTELGQEERQDTHPPHPNSSNTNSANPHQSSTHLSEHPDSSISPSSPSSNPENPATEHQVESSMFSPDAPSTPDMPLPPADDKHAHIEQLIFQLHEESKPTAPRVGMHRTGATGYAQASHRQPSSSTSPFLNLPFLPGLGDTAPAQQDDYELDILGAGSKPLDDMPPASQKGAGHSQDSLQTGSQETSAQTPSFQEHDAQDHPQAADPSIQEGAWLDEEIDQVFHGNLEQEDPSAFAALQQIQRLREQQAPISVIAGSYRGLGNLYRNRIEQGDIAPQNLMRAMKAYEQVLQFVRDTSPVWSEVLNDMGNLCWLLSRCSPVPAQGLPHLQQGIQAYQMALSKISPHTHPQTYPMIQNNLGAAYGDLARHQNPVENLQQSLEAYQEALNYRKSDLDPMRYASTQNNLGTTYWNLAQYRDPKPNLKQAIASYTESLRYYQPDQDAINYAMIQNNLGTAYWNLSQHERSDRWLRLAIESYTIALNYRTLETNPVAYAATQNNLGTAHWHLANHYDHQPKTRLDCLHQAVAAYEQALYAVEQIQQSYAQASQRHTPLNFDVLATHNNLGLVLFQLETDGDRTTFEDSSLAQDDRLDQALDHHLIALEGWQERPDLHQTALKCIIQTLKVIHNQQGMTGQSMALSKIPAQLLSEILPQL